MAGVVSHARERHALDSAMGIETHLSVDLKLLMPQATRALGADLCRRFNAAPGAPGLGDVENFHLLRNVNAIQGER